MKKIKIYISLFLICLITGCATQSTKHKAEKIYYSSSGFALIYNDLDYKNGAVSRKLNNEKIGTIHSILKPFTSVKIINMLYEAGAKEVHLRIASPPIKFPDYYGVDTPNRNELLASKLNLNEMKNFINAKTLKFLSIEGLYKAMGYEKRNSIYPQFTDHCFTGEYPINPIDANNENYQKDDLSFMSSKNI